MALAQQLYGRDRELQFHAKLVESQTRLLRYQEQLEKDLGVDFFVDMSVSETLLNLLVLKKNAMAERFRKDFGVPDKRFYHLKLRVLARSKSWGELRQWALSARPPIGWKPFVDAARKHGEIAEASFYVKRLPDAAERLDLFMALENWDEAYAIAVKLKDTEKLTAIAMAVPKGSEMASRIEGQLRGGR